MVLGLVQEVGGGAEWGWGGLLQSTKHSVNNTLRDTLCPIVWGSFIWHSASTGYWAGHQKEVKVGTQSGSL